MNPKQAWDKEVEDQIKKIESVIPWLRKIENDPDKYFEWESQKSAHQALRFIELAAWEMWSLQYYKNEKQQRLARQAFEELSDE